MKNKSTILLILFFCLQHFCEAQSPSILWQKSYGGVGNDGASQVIQTTDGGHIVIGSSYSNSVDVTGHHGDSSTSDYWVTKINSAGALLWQKSYGGIGNENGSGIIQTSDGGYILVGSSNSTNGDVTGNHGGIDIWVVKIDTVGNIQWEQSYGGSSDDDANSIIQTYDGGFLIGGRTTSNDGDVTLNHGGGDYWIVKINSAGVIQWQKSYGGSANDWAYYAIQNNDHSYLIGGGLSLLMEM
jgi:hypothetical protein